MARCQSTHGGQERGQRQCPWCPVDWSWAPLEWRNPCRVPTGPDAEQLSVPSVAARPCIDFAESLHNPAGAHPLRGPECLPHPILVGPSRSPSGGDGAFCRHRTVWIPEPHTLPGVRPPARLYIPPRPIRLPPLLVPSTLSAACCHTVLKRRPQSLCVRARANLFSWGTTLLTHPCMCWCNVAPAHSAASTAVVLKDHKQVFEPGLGFRFS